LQDSTGFKYQNSSLGVIMAFKKGIHKCAECEQKKKEDPKDMGLCSKCSASETRLEKAMYKELMDQGSFP